MAHAHSRALTQPRPTRPRAEVRQVTRAAGGHARIAARNFAATFDNNRAESIPLLAWVAWLFVTQFHHGAVDHPGASAVKAYGWAVVLAAGALFLAMKAPSKNGSTITVALYVLVVAAWSGLATGLGLSVELFVAWVVILVAMYVPFLKMILDVKHTPPTQLVLPPAEVQAAPEDPFKGIGWLTGARWEGPERATATGSVRRLGLPPGVSSRQFAETRADGMANVLRVNPQAIELSDPGLGHVVDVYRHDGVDMHAEPRRWPWADQTALDIRQEIPLGVLRNGGIASIHLDEGHTLIGGTTGSGKSVATAMLTLVGALDPQVDLYCIDPKLADMKAFEHACRMYVQNDYGQALGLLRRVAEEIPRRGELCARHNVRKVSALPAAADGSRMVPTVLLVIDELAHLTVDAPKEEREEACRLLGIILKQGRAADILLVAATQRPSAEAVPSDMRAQFKYALALRVRERNTTKMILGDAAGVDASTIPMSRRGVGYLVDDSGARLLRTFFLPDDEVFRLASSAPRAVGSSAPGLELEALPVVHELLPAQEGGPLRFPDGGFVPAGWRTDLWLATDDEYRSVSEFAEMVEKTVNPVREVLREWATRRYLTETKDGKVTKWRRAA